MVTEAMLKEEVGRFQQWADQYPLEARSDWWAEEYPDWSSLDVAVLGYTGHVPPEVWTVEAVDNILYAIARDDERLYLAPSLGQQDLYTICHLAMAAIERGESAAKWQLAVQLGKSALPKTDVEELLLHMAGDTDEYVRRRALMALAQLNSSRTEELALAAWHQSHENQEWARMAALSSLYQVQSPLLEDLLTQAESDPRPYLSGFAKRMRLGEVPE